MHKLTASRWTLPAIVIVAIITIAAIAVLLLTHTHISGIANQWPV